MGQIQVNTGQKGGRNRVRVSGVWEGGGSSGRSGSVAPSKSCTITLTIAPTVPEGHKHRVTTPKNLGKSRGPPQNPAEPRRTLGETPAEPSERQISSESLGEGCAPWMVTLRNFRNCTP